MRTRLVYIIGGQGKVGRKERKGGKKTRKEKEKGRKGKDQDK